MSLTDTDPKAQQRYRHVLDDWVEGYLRDRQNGKCQEKVPMDSILSDMFLKRFSLYNQKMVDEPPYRVFSSLHK